MNRENAVGLGNAEWWRVAEPRPIDMTIRRPMRKQWKRCNVYGMLITGASGGENGPGLHWLLFCLCAECGMRNAESATSRFRFFSARISKTGSIFTSGLLISSTQLQQPIELERNSISNQQLRGRCHVTNQWQWTAIETSRKPALIGPVSYLIELSLKLGNALA